MTHNKRKKVMINPRLQGRLLRDCCTAPLIALVAGSLIVAFLLRMVQAEATSLDVELPTLTDLMIALGLFVVACAAVFVYHGIYFSHRIAGPLYRIRVSIDRVLNGETDFPIRLRDKDYLHETAAHFRQLVTHVGERNAEIERLQALLSEHGIDANTGNPADSVDSVDAVDSAPSLVEAEADAEQPAS